MIHPACRRCCGYEKEEAIPRLSDGHKHEYTDTVVNPDCLSAGYTAHSCSCGHSWTDSEKAALGHDFVYSGDADGHYKECSRCHESKEYSPHKMGEWKTVKKAGYTFEGEKQRECKICGYVIKEIIPMQTKPEDKFVITIPEDVSKLPTRPVVTPDGGDNPNTGDTPDTPSADKDTVVKEMLSSGKDNKVPELPTLWNPKDSGQYRQHIQKTGECHKGGCGRN